MAHSYSLLLSGKNIAKNFVTEHQIIENLPIVISNMMRSPGESGIDSVALYSTVGQEQLEISVGCAKFAATSGTIGIVISDVPLTFASTGVDQNDAAAAVFAIFGSTNPLINPQAGGTDIGFVGSNVAGTISCGGVGNGDWISVCGLKMTVIPNGAKRGQPTDWNNDGSASQRALNLKQSLNESFSSNYRAEIDPDNAAIVVVFQTTPFQVLPGSVMFSNTTQLGVTAFSLSQYMMAFPVLPSVACNQITFSATGTGVTAFGTVGGRMSGGFGAFGPPVIVK